jgi:hypothetical protein
LEPAEAYIYNKVEKVRLGRDEFAHAIG